MDQNQSVKKQNKKYTVTAVALIVVFAALSIWAIFGAKATYSDSERRPLAKLPALNAESVGSGRFMSQFETYAADTFPLREQFRGLKAMVTLGLGQKTVNGIYLEEGYLSKVEYPLQEDSIVNAGKKFTFIYDKYLADTRGEAYVAVIPDKNAYLADSAGQLVMDYEVFEALVQENTSFGRYITISDLLSREDYYLTDTHWRQEQLTDVAERLLAKMGAGSSHSYDVEQAMPDFRGVYVGQAALPNRGEQLYYLTNPIIEQLEVFDNENGRKIPVYDLSKAEDKDPYEIYVGGPLSLVTIENSQVNTQKELVVFRDSFGSAIAPLLAQNYAKVTLVDIRYLPSVQLEKYIDFEGADVLFLYSTSVLNHSETLK